MVAIRMATVVLPVPGRVSVVDQSSMTAVDPMMQSSFISVINSAAPPEFRSIALWTEPPSANSMTARDQVGQGILVVDHPRG